MRPSITSREMQHIPARIVKSPTDYWAWFLDIVVSIAFVGLVLGVLVSIFLLQPSERAEAAETIHQNDYYCQQIKERGTRVLGAEGSLRDLCAKWGVEI